MYRMVCWGVVGIPLFENKNQISKASQFQTFKFSNFQIESSQVVRNTQFQSFHNWKFPHFQNVIFGTNDLDLFLDFKSILVLPKSRIIGLGRHGHVRQVQNPKRWWLFGFPNNEIDNLLPRPPIRNFSWTSRIFYRRSAFCKG